jgi:hypothetical protein
MPWRTPIARYRSGLFNMPHQPGNLADSLGVSRSGFYSVGFFMSGD